MQSSIEFSVGFPWPSYDKEDHFAGCQSDPLHM